MRFAVLFLAVTLAGLPVGGSRARAADLQCSASGSAARMLCDVLARTLAQVQKPGTVTLTAEDLAPNHLRATLTVLREGHSWSRGPADLTIMDRATIPPESIESFAAALLKGAGL